MRYAVYTYQDGTTYAFTSNNDGSGVATVSGTAQPFGVVIAKTETFYTDDAPGLAAAKANTTTLGTMLPAGG